MKEIVISKLEKDITVCVLESGEICEKYCCSEENKSILGNIYLCKVEKIMDGMQAAFVNMVNTKNAFISIKDAMEKIDVTKEKIKKEMPKMSEVVKEGQIMLVQVKKEPTDEKGARVSRHITLPGKYIVLMPDTDIITISQKIEKESEKERLLKLAKETLPEMMGAIVRTDAENISDEEIKKDIENIISLWKEIIKKAENQKEVKLLYDDHDIIKNTIRDIADKNTAKIYTNDKKISEIIAKEISKIKVQRFEDGRNIFEELGIKGEYDAIENRKKWLKCGGYIVVDSTEALTAIDVNSCKYTGNLNLEETAYKVNKEAAIEIMKQLRLKDIGGIVVIDYIDMHDETHKEDILETMKLEAKKDRSKVDIRKFTELNLVELTRKKMYV